VGLALEPALALEEVEAGRHLAVEAFVVCKALGAVHLGQAIVVGQGVPERPVRAVLLVGLKVHGAIRILCLRQPELVQSPERTEVKEHRPVATPGEAEGDPGFRAVDVRIARDPSSRRETASLLFIGGRDFARHARSLKAVQARFWAADAVGQSGQGQSGDTRGRACRRCAAGDPPSSRAGGATRHANYAWLTPGRYGRHGGHDGAQGRSRCIRWKEHSRCSNSR